jgi:DNA-binding transcriptional regulator YiaG
MAFAAHLEGSQATAGKLRSRRRKLRLEVPGSLQSGGRTNVLVHDISQTGMLLECQQSLEINDTIEVGLPQAGLIRAVVIWASGNFHGCQFDLPITAAALSAAQLQGTAGDDRAMAPREALHSDESFGLRLQRLRKQRRLTLAAIADALGVSKPTVWAWEQDRTHPIEQPDRGTGKPSGRSPLGAAARPRSVRPAPTAGQKQGRDRPCCRDQP